MLYACVHTYVHIDYVRTCVSTCVYVCINEYALTCVSTCVRVHVIISACVLTYTCRLKIGEIFVSLKKITGIQKSKKHRGDPRDHITQNTLTTLDSIGVRETPSEVRNELVHSHGRMIAQIVQHENLRCF